MKLRIATGLAVAAAAIVLAGCSSPGVGGVWWVLTPAGEKIGG
jgi:hypothetical protein